MRDSFETSREPKMLRHRGREVGSLGVVAPKCLLKIWETGSVLDVEQGATIGGDGQEVRASGELVMLERLVEQDGETVPGQQGSLDFTHERVDRVGGARSRGPSVIEEMKLRPKSERGRDRRVTRERSRVTALQPMNLRHGRPASCGDFAERQAATASLVPNLRPCLDGHAYPSLDGPLVVGERRSIRHFHAQ